MKRIFPWLLVFLIAVFWLVRLGTFPGLHADEAWSGIKAHAFLATGHMDAFGMNHYTGAMQSLLVAFFFKMLGIEVFALRIGGVLFNILGLCLLTGMLEKTKRGVATVFLLLLLQSAVWMLYPRMAWEVCSFTLPFVALFSIFHKMDRLKAGWLFPFFVTGLLSSYNHIIISCLSFAYLLACFTNSVLKGELSLKNLYAPCLNMVNIAVLFGAMNAFDGVLLQEYPIVVLLSFGVICCIETFMYGKIPYRIIPIFSPTTEQKNMIVSVLATIAFIPFLFFHGGALLDSLTSAKVLQHILGLPYSTPFHVFSLAIALIVIGTFFFYLVSDIRKNNTSLFLLFMLWYVGLLTVYTQINSTRYYLALHILIFIYLAFKIAKNRSIYVYTVLLVAGAWNTSFLTSVYVDRQKSFVAHEMYFGSRYETSNHFKPLAPMLDSLRKYQINNIRYADSENRYFLEQPILFLELIRPWKKKKGASVIIDYGSSSKNGGFIWMQEEQK